MSGFVRSSHRFPRSHHQPPVPTGLTAISIVQPTGHTRHPPQSRSSSRLPSRLRAFAGSLVGPKAPSSVFSAFCPNVRKCPVLSGLPNAPPVSTINPLYQQDLQKFTPCSRPDIGQTGIALRPIARSCHGPAGRASVPQCLRGEIPQCLEMSGFVRSSQRYPAYHHQPTVTTGLTAISTVQPTGHTRHPPEKTGTPGLSKPLVYFGLRPGTC